MSRLTAAVVTVSDGVAAGKRQDSSGDALEGALVRAGFEVVERVVVPDEGPQIAAALIAMSQAARLVISTGGTGFGPRDVTPEATRTVIEREAPGIVHLMYAKGIAQTPMAALSRGLAGTRGTGLIVNVPGSLRGALENLDAIIEVVPHLLDLLLGDTEH